MNPDNHPISEVKAEKFKNIWGIRVIGATCFYKFEERKPSTIYPGHEAIELEIRPITQKPSCEEVESLREKLRVAVEALKGFRSLSNTNLMAYSDFRQIVYDARIALDRINSIKEGKTNE